MNNELIGIISSEGELKGVIAESGPQGPPGTTNYNDLTNKPRIESVELIGNKTLDEIGIRIMTENEIDLLF